MFKQYYDACPESIKSLFQPKIFEPQQIILEAGSAVDFVYILTSGKAEVLAQNEDGQYICWGFYSPWILFGELELFTGRCIQSMVRAVSRCELLKIDRMDFLRWLDSDREFTYALFRRVSEGLLNLEDYAQLAIGGTLEQKAAYLLQKNESESTVPLTKQALANRMGTSMRSLNRIVKNLTEKGCIEITGTLIRVKDSIGLQKIYKKSSRDG